MKTGNKHSKKKIQHYVPRFYLKYFTDKNKHEYEDEFLWVFERPMNFAFRKAPKNIGFESYFYSFKRNDEYVYVIEDMLAKIEHDVKEVFKDILNDRFTLQRRKNREVLSTFICLMNYRTLRSKESYRILYQNTVKTEIIKQINQEGFESNYKRFLKTTGREEESIPDEREFIKSFNKIKIIPAKEDFLKMMLDMTGEMIPYVYQRKWALLIPEENNRFFVTSDNPVLLYNENINNPNFIPGLGVTETDIIFPIFPQLCLFVSHNIRECTQKTCTHDVVLLNQKIANNCHKYVFSNINNFEQLFSEN